FIKNSKERTQSTTDGVSPGRPLEQAITARAKRIPKAGAETWIDLIVQPPHWGADDSSVIERTETVMPGAARPKTVLHLQIDVKLQQIRQSRTFLNLGAGLMFRENFRVC